MAKAKTEPAVAAVAPAATETVKFRLNHFCHRPGCEGSPTEVIEISHADADYLLARGGGSLADVAAKPKKVKRDEDAGDSEQTPAGDVGDK